VALQAKKTGQNRPSSALVMEILEVVKLRAMDPLYCVSSYYSARILDAGVKAYQFLMKAHGRVRLRSHREAHHAASGSTIV